jgi:hypothetical protein
VYKENIKLRNEERDQQAKIAANGTLEQQSTCAAQADKERLKPYKPLQGTTLVLRTVTGHYNAALNRCLILERATTKDVSSGEITWWSTVVDAFDGKDFALMMTQRDKLESKPEKNVGNAQ